MRAVRPEHLAHEAMTRPTRASRARQSSGRASLAFALPAARVGRGRERSTCLLLYRAPLGETAKARIQILRETEDGFRIAEEDLRLRGEGDVLGTRQSGMPGFKVARIETHGPLLEPARKDAQLVLARDPTLTTERGEALRHLLYLFDRDEAIRLLRAG